jgi:HlyD family secretion protein
MRAGLQQGTRFKVSVDGAAQPFDATALRIASEPTFTPYYALSGDDASRLAWRAELALDASDKTKDLPAGIPCRATLSAVNGSATKN